MRKWFLIFLLAVFAWPAFCQDQLVSTGGSPYADIVRGAAWGTNAFNRVFLFTPLTPDQRFCLFVANNNPTNSHTFSLAVYQTGDRQLPNYSYNTGRFIQDTVQGTLSPVAASSMVSAYVHANAGALIALVFSGGTTAAGSPDTADIFLVQTTAESCGPVNPSTGQFSTLSTPNTGTSAAPSISVISDGISQAFSSSQIITNPTAAEEILHLNANNGSRTIYPKELFLNCTAACNVIIQTTTSLGTACTTNFPVNLKGGSAVATTALVNFGCTGNPSTSLQPYFVTLAANQILVIDLAGYIFPAGTTTGVNIIMNGALTGNIGANFKWYEK